MIRFRLKELIAEKEFRERRVITITEVAKHTGINRMTLSKISNHPGYSTVTDNLDRLCDYFKCKLEQLAEHIPSPDNKFKHIFAQCQDRTIIFLIFRKNITSGATYDQVQAKRTYCRERVLRTPGYSTDGSGKKHGD